MVIFYRDVAAQNRWLIENRTVVKQQRRLCGSFYPFFAR